MTAILLRMSAERKPEVFPILVFDVDDPLKLARKIGHGRHYGTALEAIRGYPASRHG
jgi:hypothetical protein